MRRLPAPLYPPLLPLHIPKIHNATIFLDDREISKIYWPVMFSRVSRKALKCIFDFHLKFQFENEYSFLRMVLRRVIANLKLLASNTTCLQGTP